MTTDSSAQDVSNSVDALPDVQDVQTTNDVATDAGDGSTGASCQGNFAGLTLDPMHYFYYYYTIRVARIDATAVSGMADETSTFLTLRQGNVVPPAEISQDGSCIYHPVRLTGASSRNNADDVDFGNITIRQNSTQGSKLIRGTYTVESTDAGIIKYYAADETMAHPLLFDVDTTLSLATSDAGVAAMTTLRFPPPIAQGSYQLPTALSRTTDSVVTWTPPATGASDLVAVFWTFDSARSNVIVCAAPACKGRLTVPASMVNHYGAGDGGAVMVTSWFNYIRYAQVMVNGQTIDYRLESVVETPIPVQ